MLFKSCSIILKSFRAHHIIPSSSLVILCRSEVIPSFLCHSKSSRHFFVILNHPMPSLHCTVIPKSSRHFTAILCHPMPSPSCPVVPMSSQHSSVIQKSFHHPEVMSSPSHHSILIPCHPLSFRSHPVISLSSLIIPCHCCIVLSFPCHPSIPVSFKSRSSILLESFRAHHIIPS